MIWLILLLVVDGLFLAAAILFTYESFREHEPRAPIVGCLGVAFHLAVAAAAIFIPPLRLPLAVLMGLMLAGALVFVVPWKTGPRAGHGAQGHVVGEVTRADERDIVFARNRSIPPDPEIWRRYYEAHPDWEPRDAARRERGGPLGRPGAIDGGLRPNVAMMASAFGLPAHVGPHARVEPPPGIEPADIDPARATKIVKHFALHLGADLVGVCRVDPRWAYSHRGEIYYDNWDDWGREIGAPLPYALVIATQMKHDMVAGGPHTPAVVESGTNYARGAYVTTILAGWFGAMGYRAAAHHNRHYDFVLPPLAMDAGLGEVGRLGYLISDRFGPRVRLFAVTTDLPLVPDEPIDLGVDEFCSRCLKCASSCPSRSIPQGDKVIVAGVMKWKLDAESCFDYWGKIGTDCSVCMGVCPFSRPNRSIHRLVRGFLKRSGLARRIFPYIDNLLYGKKWKPRPVPDWVAYQ